jgi:hypothetical protein
MRDSIMGRDGHTQPSGTPTERVVWVALWHLGTFHGSWTWGTQLWCHVGGSVRSVEGAILSLIKRGIAERVHSEEGIWGYRLTLKYAQRRICPQIDEIQFGIDKKRFDDPTPVRHYIPASTVGKDLF